MAICRIFSVAAVLLSLTAPVSFGATSSYYAVCTDSSHSSGWRGHVYRNREQAQTEADQHNVDNPGHHAYVMGN